MKLPNKFNGLIRYFLFTILFYSLYPVSRILGSAKLELTSFTGRMIGEATYEGVDVAARIWIFYKCVLAFIILAIALGFVAYYLTKKIKNLPQELILINHVSLLGVGFYVFKLLDMNIGQGIELVYYLHKAALVGIGIHFLFLRGNSTINRYKVQLFMAGLILGVAIYCGINQWSFALFDKKIAHNIFNFFIYGIVIVYLLVVIHLKQDSHVPVSTLITNTLSKLFPIAVLLIFPVLIDEVYMYFNNHYIFSVTPIKLVSFYSFSVLIWIAYNYFKPHTQKQISPTKYLATRYLPITFAGVAALLHYNPFIGPSNELFELANRMLPVSEFFRFGVIPFIEKFNSHLLSETFFGFIYTMLYGLKSQEMFIYDFMYPVIHLVVSGIFIFHFTRNVLATIFIILILPAFPAIVPEYFSITLLSVFVLQRFIDNADSIKNYFILYSWLVLMVLWRIDLGYPLIVASLLVITIYRIGLYRSYFNYKLLFKSGILFFGTLFVMLLFVSWLREFNLFTAIANELGYLSSSQSYGTKTLGQNWIREFRYHHYFLPLVAVLIAGSVLVRFKQFNISRNYRFVSISILFMIVFYFVNFQRGLVRHGFAEGVDLFMSSHIFLIICGSSYLYLRNRSHSHRLIVFSLLGIASMFYIKYPAQTNSFITLNDALNKIQNRPLISPQSRYIVRCNEDEYFKFSTYSSVQEFVNTHLNRSQTFGDFSNTPMLYHYTQRECPAYFPQNVLSVHNDKLQDDAIGKMNEYDIPYVVMGHLYDNWWDRTDGVENSVRHYRLAEYFYQHYEPAYVLQNNYFVWKRNDIKLENNAIDTLMSYKGKLLLPTDSVSCRYLFLDTLRVNAGCKYMLHITYNTDKEFLDPVFHGYSRKHERDAFRLWPSVIDKYNREAWYVFEPFDTRTFHLSVERPEKISSISFIKYKYIPDVSSHLPRSINVQRLGYIWANYDKKIKDQQKLFVHQSKNEFISKVHKVRISIPADIDRASGNYAWLKFHHLQENTETDVQLSYGKDSTLHGNFVFKIPGDKKKLPFVAIRLSSQYNWMSQSSNWIELKYLTTDKKQLLVEELSILKGD